MKYHRRSFLQSTSLALAGLQTGLHVPLASAQIAGDRPAPVQGVKVLNPRGRVPVSLIIDDSTCLVNLAHFGIPQFAQTFPEQYKQDWRSLPREIPDSFVRSFGEWCAEQGVKGKYSIVPYPACVGWVDRFLPGWTEKELKESLKLVKDLMLPNWDIHPEMVSHTRVIDTQTGRPYEDCSEYFMENWRWTDGKSVDELSNYLAYALRVLHRVDLPCEGITTPGGFAGRVLPELAQATLEACRDVYQTEIPHYFKHLYTDETSVAPRVEYASGLDTDDPRCVVSIIGCTGDWFGGWDGLEAGNVDQLITQDLQGGRLPEVIQRGEPAIMVCHWPGIYFNGEETGFSIFKEAVRRLHEAYDHLIWMKLSEIARYWAAKELTRIEKTPKGLRLHAPFATSKFTLQIDEALSTIPTIQSSKEGDIQLKTKQTIKDLNSDTAVIEEEKTTLCFNLPKGMTEITWI